MGINSNNKLHTPEYFHTYSKRYISIRNVEKMSEVLSMKLLNETKL
jgi:hypothetical protein